MKIADRDLEFIIIGENIHTTRVVRRQGKLIANTPDGVEAVRFTDAAGQRRYLTIPDAVKKTQDYEDGKVKHVAIAVKAAMTGVEPEATDGNDYLSRMVRRQADAGTDFLDLNVDEISPLEKDQKEAMRWLVQTIQGQCGIPIALDSSSTDVLETGLQTYDGNAGRPLLNSASLERLDALDLAVKYHAQVVITAAGEEEMPEDTEGRVANATRIVDTAVSRGVPLSAIYVDPLVFPISVDAENGNQCLEAIRQLRAHYGPEIHLTGGFSNISFGVPCRRLVNDVFLNLAADAGADSGIIDPVNSRLDEVFTIDRESRPYQVASEMLLGRDDFCANFLMAYRDGELEG